MKKSGSMLLLFAILTFVSNKSWADNSELSIGGIQQKLTQTFQVVDAIRQQDSENDRNYLLARITLDGFQGMVSSLTSTDAQQPFTQYGLKNISLDCDDLVATLQGGGFTKAKLTAWQTIVLARGRQQRETQSAQ